VALGDFYTQVTLIALAAAGILYAMAKKCTDNIDKLEDSLSHEGYLIQSHIWTTDIKDAVEDFVSFIQRNIFESESEDKYIELFLNKEKVHPLKSRLGRLRESYNAYLDFTSLFPNLVEEHEKMKKWLIRTIAICFGFASWGAVGFLMGTSVDFYSASGHMFWSLYYFWVFFVLLIVLSIISIYGIIAHNRKCQLVKNTIRTEKSKYGDVLEKVV